MTAAVILPTARLRLLVRRLLLDALCGLMRRRSQPLSMSSAAGALIIAPHPDDETLGCAGLILAKQSSGAAVSIVFLTDGSGSHPGHPTLTPEALKTLRRAEAIAASTTLGLRPAALRFLDARDGSLARLPADEAGSLVARLAACLSDLHPAEIYLPYRRDGSSEHEAGFGVVIRALALSGQSPRILEYPIWSRWSPRLLLRALRQGGRIWRVDFPAAVALKSAAVHQYHSQIEPVAPWPHAVLPAGFTSRFLGAAEFFLEARP